MSIIDFTGPAGSAANAVAAPVAQLSMLAKAGDWLATPYNWLRIVEVIGGVSAIIMGLGLIVSQTKTAQTAVDSAGKAAAIGAMA